LGPISPNYGSYFGIASINVNDVPVPKLWTHYIDTHLDTNTNPLEFTGFVRVDPRGPTAVQEFRQHIDDYAWVGVKYVVTLGNPLASSLAPGGRLRRVFDDGLFDVFQLSGTAPFFQASSQGCRVSWTTWSDATADCTRGTTLVRRELYMAGWSASVNGRPTHVGRSGGLFQVVHIPRGHSSISFAYSPPHEDLGVVAFFLAVVVVVGGMMLAVRRRREHGSHGGAEVGVLNAHRQIDSSTSPTTPAVTHRA